VRIKILLASIFSVIIILISGCSTQSDGLVQPSAPVSEAPVSSGTSGQLISIQSDNVSAAGYDEISMVMTVRFKNGALYEYYQIPLSLWNSFLEAQPNPWSLIGYPQLVNGGYSYRRIG
jgi:hypothetical protein